MLHLDGPEGGDDVGHRGHEGEPDGDEQEDREAVKVFAVRLAGSREGHLSLAGHARTLVVVGQVVAVENQNNSLEQPT